jgi:hypothetical protein
VTSQFDLPIILALKTMKRLPPREIAFLLLPITFIAGFAVWRSQGGKLAMPNPFDPGPARLVNTPFKKVELTPLDRFHRYAWKGSTMLSENGRLKLPADLKEANSYRGGIVRVHLEYRTGNSWNTVPTPKPSQPLVDFPPGIPDGEIPVLLNLSTVPPDAEGVRFRGRFVRVRTYRGTLPSGWELPEETQSQGTIHNIPIFSEPFDVELKAPGQPKPMATPQSLLAVKEAKWFSITDVKPERQVFLVRLQQIHNEPWDIVAISIENTRVFDADGRELKMMHLSGSPAPSDFLMNWNEIVILHPDKAGAIEVSLNPEKWTSSHMLPLISEYFRPQGGWAKVKQPVRLEADISDGTCWPVHMKLFLKQEKASAEELKRFANGEM